MRTAVRLATGGMIGGLACAAMAQMFNPGYGSYGAPMSSFLATSALIQQSAANTVAASARSSAKGRAVPAKTATGTSVFAPTSPPLAPKALAAGYPAAVRADAEKFFQQALEGYHKIESQFGLARYDMAGATAAFIAGNYSAYRQEPFPDAYFQPLVRQMRGALTSTPALSQAKASERQEMYEQLAILGTYMALTQQALARSPDPALQQRTKDAARTYLQQFLKEDPERLRITASGLEIH